MQKSILIKIRCYCAYQERCHSEVRYKLLELGPRGLDLEEYIVHLIQEDFLNEERFARAYAGGKFRVLKWGKQKIVQNLKQKQVSAYCIKKALQEIIDDDYLATLQQLIEKKWSSLRQPRLTLSIKQKLLSYAHAKGYEHQYIMLAIGRLGA